MRVWLFMLFVMLSAMAYTVRYEYPDEIVKGVPFTLKVYIVDDTGGIVQYPQCNLTVIDGNEEKHYIMTAKESWAEETIIFSFAGENEISTVCQIGSSQLSSGVIISVKRPATASISTNGASKVGETLRIQTDYRDEYGILIGGTCSGIVYVNGKEFKDFQDSLSLLLEKPGQYAIDVTCFDPFGEYATAHAHKEFTVNKVPLEVFPDRDYVEGYYGEKEKVLIGVKKEDAICTSSSGLIQKVLPNQYLLEYNLNFVGEKRVMVTCTHEDYYPTTIYITFKGREVPTLLEVNVIDSQFPLGKIYSFEKIYLLPIYMTQDRRIISGASCSVEFNGKKYAVANNNRFEISAPAGPSSFSVKISCKKYGYERSSKEIVIRVNPRPMKGQISIPEEVKKGESVNFEVLLVGPDNATCEFYALLIDELGERKEIKKKLIINESSDEGILAYSSFTPTKPGKIKYTVNCSSPGYLPFKMKGEISVKIFSTREEIEATIALTILTALIAVGFMLIRRWI